MTLEEYYRILAIEWDRVNKEDLQEIRQYNRRRYDLRKLILEEEENNNFYSSTTN